MRALRGRSASLTHTLEQAQQAARSFTAKLPTGSLPADFVPSLLARVLPGSALGLKPGAPATDMQAGSFTAKAGTRPYRLFIPRHAAPRPALIVMLHGCTQTPENFAAGTRMNALAGQAGAYVLYPAQLASANAQRCWNWFNPADQQPEGGEAGIIAAMTQAIAAEHRIDPAQIFAAGLSAGGAQAAILGATHPEIFSAIGVHSGLACGAAREGEVRLQVVVHQTELQAEEIVAAVREEEVVDAADEPQPPQELVPREGSRSRVGCANDRPCESTRYLLHEIALALEPPTVVARPSNLACSTRRLHGFPGRCFCAARSTSTFSTR